MKQILKYGFTSLLLVATAAMQTACSDDDASATLYEAVYPQSVSLVVSDDLQKYVYTDDTGATTLPLLEGQQAKLSYTILPDSATFNEVSWQSSNVAVATVDADGLVNAVSGGGYSIIQVAPSVFYSGSGIYSTLKVKVDKELIPAESIEVSAKTTEVYRGSKTQLSATVYPSDATYQTVEWSSADESIATVDSEGVVTGVVDSQEEVTVTIIATSMEGAQVTGEIEITVMPTILPESITVNPLGYDMMVGEVAQMTCTLTPENATVEALNWASSDATIATVDENGNVTAVAAGTVTITASESESGCTGSVEITIGEGALGQDFGATLGSWTFRSGGETYKFNGDYMSVTMTVGTNGKYDAQLGLKNATMNVGTYRYYAVKLVRPGAYALGSNTNGTIFVDTNQGRYMNQTSTGNNQYTILTENAPTVDQEDEPVVIYFDLQQPFKDGYLFSTSETEIVSKFELNFRDIPAATYSDTFRIYWMHTFKTLDDLRTFVANDTNE